jgi:hypothetical protein
VSSGKATGPRDTHVGHERIVSKVACSWFSKLVWYILRSRVSSLTLHLSSSSSSCTHPSTDPAPCGLDLDLPFPTFWFGYLLKTQVFSAMKTHGIHKFSRRHVEFVDSWTAVFNCALQVGSLAMLVRQLRADRSRCAKTTAGGLRSTLLYTIS